MLDLQGATYAGQNTALVDGAIGGFKDKLRASLTLLGYDNYEDVRKLWDANID